MQLYGQKNDRRFVILNAADMEKIPDGQIKQYKNTKDASAKRQARLLMRPNAYYLLESSFCRRRRNYQPFDIAVGLCHHRADRIHFFSASTSSGSAFYDRQPVRMRPLRERRFHGQAGDLFRCREHRLKSTPKPRSE